MSTNLRSAVPLGFLILTAAVQASPLPDEDVQIDKKIVVAEDEDPVVVHVTGRSRHGYLGVGLLEITPELRTHFGVGRDAGILVSSVEPDSPAAKAGLEVGDIIVKANGESIESTQDLSHTVRAKKAGDTVQLEISRNRANKTLTATVAERRVHGRTITMPEVIDIGDLQHHIAPMLGHMPDWKSFQDRLSEIEKRLDGLEKKKSAR
jgi:membrane-associated protease RseP (regulator of RpoE activity)